MNVNLKLKGGLYERFGSQKAAANHMGIWEPDLSRIVRGRKQPNTIELQKLSRIFSFRQLRRLFPEQAHVVDRLAAEFDEIRKRNQ